MKTRDLIKLFLSLLIISGILYFLYVNDYFTILEKISFAQWVLLLGLTFVSFFISGTQQYTMVKYISGTAIRGSDIIFMPMSMSLFSYFIPTNGGILYTIYFLKKKYHVDTSKGFSVGVVSIYISFIVSGLATLIALYVFDLWILWLVLLAVLMIISPLLVYFCNRLLQKIPFRTNTFPRKVQHYVDDVIRQSNRILKNVRITAINIVLTTLALVIIFLMYYQLNSALETKMSVLSLIALITMQRISSLIRVLPGNLGLEELFTAGLFTIIGQDPSIGLLFSVFMRFCTVVWMIPGGVLHTMFNAAYFSFKDLRNILGKKKQSQEKCGSEL